MSSIFDKHYKKYDAWYDKNRYAYLSELETIRKVLPKKGKGLEIGVGTGRFAAPLGIKFGVDPSKNMIKIARQRGVDAKFGFGEELPFKSSSFDYICIIITLAFTKDPAKVLLEAKRVLRKKGRIIIGIVDKDSFLGKYYKRKKTVFYKQADLLRAKDLITMLKAIGFKSFSYYQTVFRLPASIKSIEKPQKGFGKGGFAVISAVK
jgi:ubiquinone/menaquinone biosynthesis C-methylase UbiE